MKLFFRTLPRLLSCTVLATLAACSPGESFTGGTQHIISYGQSLSSGERAVVRFPDDLSIPTDYENVGLMFSDGVRSMGLLPLVPFLENTIPAPPSGVFTPTGGETPLYGALKQLQDLPGVRIGSAAGRGATNIEGLSRGSVPYERLLRQVHNAKAVADPPYSVPALIWLQGESDAAMPSHLYAQLLSTLHADLNADIKAITGQVKTLQIHICLVAMAGPASAQRAVAASNPNVHIACENDKFEHSDGLHFSAAGSRAAGHALGNSIRSKL